MSKRITRIVAGIATIHETDQVLSSALALAQRTGAELHLVHAYELPDPILGAYAREGLLGPQFGARYRDDMKARLEESVAGATSEVRVHTHAHQGAAGDVLCAQAEALGADLLMIGATRSGKFLRTILGSTAERVVRGSTVPVLVLRHPLADPLRRVLLTTDLSDFSASVHERGLDVVESLIGGDVPEPSSLLVVWYDVSFPPPLRRDSLEQVARTELDEFLRARRPRGTPVSPRIRFGDPSKEITADAIDWQAELLVLGTHSRAGRSRFLLGSVAEATVRTSQTNVLILPPEGGSRAQAIRDEAAQNSSAA